MPPGKREAVRCSLIRMHTHTGWRLWSDVLFPTVLQCHHALPWKWMWWRRCTDDALALRTNFLARGVCSHGQLTPDNFVLARGLVANLHS